MREFLPTLTTTPDGVDCRVDCNERRARKGEADGDMDDSQNLDVWNERARQGDARSDGLPFRYVVTDVAQVKKQDAQSMKFYSTCSCHEGSCSTVVAGCYEFMSPVVFRVNSQIMLQTTSIRLPFTGSGVLRAGITHASHCALLRP